MFRIQIQKGEKVLLWNQVKPRMETCYSELILVPGCIAIGESHRLDLE